MQFSESWLRSLCNPPLNTEALCHVLTMAGLEVEDVKTVAPEFSGVFVAQVLTVEKHPDADKLNLCSVDAGQGDVLQIVCGAPNVAAGLKVPCAVVGAPLARHGPSSKPRCVASESRSACSARHVSWA
jgi:phenylalanyl-tRNA synthetase beta chain